MMTTQRRVLWGAVSVIALGLSVPAITGAKAADAAHPLTQNEIAMVLKTRGLPTLGSQPAESRDASRQNTSSVAYTTTAKPRAQQSAAAAAHPSLAFDTIKFEFGSADLRPESIETLKALGGALNEQLKDEKTFMIEGHTDATGEKAYNEDLSRRRAQAVKDYLVNELHVSADRLQIAGRGDQNLADPAHPNSPENRRVVVINMNG